MQLQLERNRKPERPAHRDDYMEAFKRVVEQELTVRPHWHLERVLRNRPRGWKYHYVAGILRDRGYTELDSKVSKTITIVIWLAAILTQVFYCMAQGQDLGVIQ